jgi:uncharacterized membrane protein YobD (UPF0266 family)
LDDRTYYETNMPSYSTAEVNPTVIYTNIVVTLLQCNLYTQNFAQNTQQILTAAVLVVVLYCLIDRNRCHMQQEGHHSKQGYTNSK